MHGFQLGHYEITCIPLCNVRFRSLLKNIAGDNNLHKMIRSTAWFVYIYRTNNELRWRKFALTVKRFK